MHVDTIIVMLRQKRGKDFDCKQFIARKLLSVANVC